MRNKIRLTESQLHRVIKESVKRVLNEIDSSTVHNTMSSMSKAGAKERAQHIGDLAAYNYGGPDLVDAGYTVGRNYSGDLSIGRMVPSHKKGRSCGSEAEDRLYDDELAKYNNRNFIGRLFHKKPQQPVDYGKPDYVQTGEKIFQPSQPRTSNTKIARQATKLSQWLGNYGKSSDFRK